MEIATAFVTIRPQTDGFESELAAAVGNLEQPVTLTAEADVADAEAEIDSLDGAPVEVPVDADVDAAQGEIDGIESTPVEVPVTADTSAAESKIESLGTAVEDLLGDLGPSGGAMSNFGTAALGAAGASTAAVAGVGALAVGLGYAASEAGEAEVAIAQLDQMVANMGANAGVTSPGLQRLATEIQETAGFSDEAVMSGEAMVLMFENVRNVAGQPIFDRVIRDSADLARSPAFNGDISGAARTLGRALDDPVAGMSRLRRAGIQLTDSQQATITALQESGDLVGAQAALLDVVEGKVGGLAAAYGDTLAGEIDKSKESIGEAAEEIGASMLPALADLAQFLGGAARGFRLLNDDANDFWADQRVNYEDNPSGEAGKDVFGHERLAQFLEDAQQQVTGTNDAAKGWINLGAAQSESAAAAEEATAAQEQAAAAVADTLPALGDVIAGADRAGEAFGVMGASSDPQVIIDNLTAAISAWDDFQANIEDIAGSFRDDVMGPTLGGQRIAAALQQLGPQVAGGLAAALAQASPAVIGQLDSLIGEIQARGGDVSAVLTGFAANGMAGAVGAVDAAAPAMGAAGQGAGTAGAAGIDAGLATTAANVIGQGAGVSYGAGTLAGLGMMAGSVSAVANSLLANAGSTSAAFSRGQALGISYGAGIVAGLAGQVGAVAANRALLDATATEMGRALGRGDTTAAPVSNLTLQVDLDGRVVAERVFAIDHQRGIAEGFEQ